MTILFLVLATVSVQFLLYILREFYFLSQPQIQSNSTSNFQEIIILCLSRKFIPVLKNSTRNSFSVLAANSIKFYRFLLRQNHSMSQLQIHCQLKKISDIFIFCLRRKFKAIPQIYSKTMLFLVLATVSVQFFCYTF